MSQLRDAVDDPADLCARLQRDARARAVMLLGEEGEFLAHAGQAATLSDLLTDAVGDLVAELFLHPPSPDDADGLVDTADGLQLCASPVGPRAAVVVAFDDTSSLSLVRTRVRQIRDRFLRSLDAR